MPKLAAILATLAAALTELVGVTVMVTTRATGDPGIVSDTGLTLTALGFLGILATAPLACRALHTWSRDRAYVLYHEHQAQDATLATASITHLTRAGT